MGVQDVRKDDTPELRRAFTRAILRDLEALEAMLEGGLIESGKSRIGAEQELVLIDRSGRPAPINEQVLERLDDKRFTTELGRFNVECNVEPLAFRDDCLRRLEDRVSAMVARVRSVAHALGAEVVLTGILPSLQKDDLSLENLTDRPRYHRLNEVIGEMRDGPQALRISGVDELAVTHDNIMLEACNTSFQVHFQVNPDQFARKYNIAQAVAAPVLAASVNSPLLFGRRLWQETRIALFQQSIDTRATSPNMRRFQPRVSFGSHWIESDATEIFKEDIARFKPFFPFEPGEDPLEMLERGEVPPLEALCLHNGTVYRWNRPCYGVSKGIAHVRIENRVLPSGPTPVDEVANAALWFGLMKGLALEVDDVAEAMDFDDAHENFLAAARHGLESTLRWPGVGSVPARELILGTMLPMAQRGLEAAEIDASDVDRYLGVVERRVATGRTGAAWLLKSLSMAKDVKDTPGRAHCRLSGAMARRQLHGHPVHAWQPVAADEFAGDKRHIMTVGQFMVTDLFTVQESDVIDLVTNMMHWRHIRHIPVEDDHNRLVGIVSYRDIIRHFSKARDREAERAVAVSEIMKRDPVTCDPSTTTVELIRLMSERQVACVPVVDDGRLVGIVTEHDLMGIASPILERFLSE